MSLWGRRETERETNLSYAFPPSPQVPRPVDRSPASRGEFLRNTAVTVPPFVSLMLHWSTLGFDPLCERVRMSFL